MPDLAHGHALIEGTGRAILESDLNLFVLVAIAIAVVRAANPIHPFNRGGQGAVVANNPVTLAQKFSHDGFDLVSLPGCSLLVSLLFSGVSLGCAGGGGDAGNVKPGQCCARETSPMRHPETTLAPGWAPSSLITTVYRDVLTCTGARELKRV